MRPEVVVVFGGPNIPADAQGRKEFLQARRAIDFYIKWDGEKAFVSLYRKLADAGMDVERVKRGGDVSENCCYLVGNEYM